MEQEKLKALANGMRQLAEYAERKRDHSGVAPNAVRYWADKLEVLSQPGQPVTPPTPDSLVFIPGHFRCTQCGFVLSKQTIHAPSGAIGITADNLLTEPCPNDGTMMVKVTWREHAEGLNEMLDKEIKDRVAREENATMAEHRSHVDFENELYATLVDPVAEGSIKEAEMRKQLLESARWYRQHVHDLETQINAHHAASQPAMGLSAEQVREQCASLLEQYAQEPAWVPEVPAFEIARRMRSGHTERSRPIKIEAQTRKIMVNDGYGDFEEEVKVALRAPAEPVVVDQHDWRTVIVGLPIIRKLLNGEDVTLNDFRISMIPDDVLFNARPERGKAEGK